MGINAHRTLPDGRTLNAVMEFDRVVQVHSDGSVTNGPSNAYAPEVYWHTANRIEQGDGWELMNGYSGQQSYRGPVMHPSEFIGGSMADDILSTPGLYVAVVVKDLDNATEDETSEVGWAVAYRAHHVVTSTLGSQVYCAVCGHGGCE